MNAPIEDDRAGFLRAILAILANPAADLPRLVYADWLDEQVNQSDSDRAEFIRVQCQLDARDPELKVACKHTCMPPNFGGCPHRELKVREWELWDRHKTTWFGERWAILFLPHEEMGWQPDVREAVIRRGFVAEVADTLDGHLGGECQRCAETGIYTDDEMTCSSCSGTGRTPGRLRDLRTRHPIEAVRVTDRRPWRNEDGSYSWWMMYHGTSEEPADIPETIWKLLPKNDERSNYTTEAAAVEALSQALLSLTNPEPTPCPL
jgi:uncharacterized protein (TIGR02996 family)